MALKTKDLISILPFEDDVRQELADTFDSLDAERKYEIVELLWDAYNALFDQLLENNMNQELEKGLEGEAEIDKTFYVRMRAKTTQEMQKLNVSSIDEAKLHEARRAMELIVKEIQASKKH